jgi:tRNA (adenine22-N1)-methyltransferase
MGRRYKRLPPRLEAAASFVRHGVRLCDVGSDHARLPIALLRRGKINSALLTDINPGPLQCAHAAAEKAGLLSFIRFRLTDGLQNVVSEETDCITMTGLGGETIAAILAAAPWAQGKTLVLQPMQGLAELRSFLCGAGYAVTAETIAREGERLYHVMAVTGGRMVLTPGELEAGAEQFLNGHPYWPLVLARGIKRHQDELAALTVSAKPGDDTRAEHTARVLNDLRRLLHESKHKHL